MNRSALLLVASSCLIIACVDGVDIGSSSEALTAHCEIQVIGKGSRAIETDYLPNVVACENGNADTEALKVQAVAARTYAYYKIATAGEIKDGTGDQVYSCTHANAEQRHFDAVAATSGEVLVYQGEIIAGFYVAGAEPSTSDCVALPSDPDPTNTERYVTYNAAKSGDQVTQSSLGLVDPKNLANRGCSSQNGAHCLSQGGQSYQQILRFYYGADIELVRATGSCVVVEKDGGVDGATDGEPDSVAADTGQNDIAPASDANNRYPKNLEGGCQLAVARKGPPAVVLLLLLLLLRRR